MSDQETMSPPKGELQSWKTEGALGFFWQANEDHTVTRCERSMIIFGSWLIAAIFLTAYTFPDDSYGKSDPEQSAKLVKAERKKVAKPRAGSERKTKVLHAKREASCAHPLTVEKSQNESKLKEKKSFLRVKADKKNRHFLKGDLVCFNMSRRDVRNASRAERRRSCGKISRVAKDYFIVHVSVGLYERVERCDEALAFKTAWRPSSVVSFLYVYTPKPVSEYKGVAYEAPRSETNSSLWRSAEISQSSWLGGALSYKKDVMAHSSFLLGLKYVRFKSSYFNADYDLGFGDGDPEFNLFAASVVSKVSWAVSADYFHRPLRLAKGLEFVYGAGLELDYTKLRFRVVKRDDFDNSSRQTIFEGESRILTLSPKLATGIIRRKGNWETSLILVVKRPLFQFGEKFDSKSNNDHEGYVGGQKSSQSQFKEALGQRKTPLGLDLMIGIGRAF